MATQADVCDVPGLGRLVVAVRPDRIALFPAPTYTPHRYNTERSWGILFEIERDMCLHASAIVRHAGDWTGGLVTIVDLSQ